MQDLKDKIYELAGVGRINSVAHVSYICPHCKEETVYEYTYNRWSRQYETWLEASGFYCAECEHFHSFDALEGGDE